MGRCRITVRPLILTVLGSLLIPAFAWAQAVEPPLEPPLPARKSGDLQSLRSALTAQEQEKSALEKQLKTSEKDMEGLQARLVAAADSVRDNEVLLQSLNERIETMAQEEAAISVRLESDYAALADLVLALERLRRVPPEALVVRPGAPLQTAQTALLLRTMLPTINQRAAGLSDDLNKLQALRTDLARDREQALKTQTVLQQKYQTVQTLAEERTSLHKKLNGDYKQTADAVNKIARQARSMEEFLEQARLEEERRVREAAEQRQREESARLAAAAQQDGSRTGAATSAAMTRAAAARAPTPTPIPKAGQSRLPVTGMILTRYGEQDAIGAAAQGLTIESQPQALVTAPMGGIVRFSGTFNKYGQLVIIEHDKSFHSLIGGLGTANVVVGQSVAAGEPVGKLSSSSSRGGKPTLYYELRQKGRPVNPSLKFSDLKT